MSKLNHRLKRLESGALMEPPTLIAFVPRDWEHEDRAFRISAAAEQHGIGEQHQTMTIETSGDEGFRTVVVPSMSSLLDAVAARGVRIGISKCAENGPSY